METKILEELKQIKLILSKITGTEDLPTKERFSKEALDKAAKEYQDMVIKRGEWVSNSDLSDVSKIYSWNSGKFIIEKFGFSSYFQRGKSLYYNKKDLIALKNELKERKIDLERYIELTEDQEKFEKYIANVNLSKGKNKNKNFEIPDFLEDIETKPYLISEEIIIGHGHVIHWTVIQEYDSCQVVVLLIGKRIRVTDHHSAIEFFGKFIGEFPQLKEKRSSFSYELKFFRDNEELETMIKKLNKENALPILMWLYKEDKN